MMNAEMKTVANRVIWFESAEEALEYPERFLAYLMTYGTLEEILIAKKYFSDQEFERALRNAPPGNFRCSVVELLESRL
jgi:phospholipid N-methyltransferase